MIKTCYSIFFVHNISPHFSVILVIKFFFGHAFEMPGGHCARQGSWDLRYQYLRGTSSWQSEAPAPGVTEASPRGIYTQGAAPPWVSPTAGRVGRLNTGTHAHFLSHFHCSFYISLAFPYLLLSVLLIFFDGSLVFCIFSFVCAYPGSPFKLKGQLLSDKPSLLLF